ncbi:hypothetical protein BGW42_005124 [Actinomortierella wolfii]|nr:hypothetical protein BGW42_005124 [Actinomortierella wolfii]
MATYSHPPADVAVDDFSDREERYGEFSNVISRPKLYDILRKLVPEEKILCGKQVVAIQQNDECAMIMCSDNTKYYGDIIVGADGAYSSVRNSLYKELKTKGLLPNEDDTDPPFNTLCLVGVTRPLSPGALELEENECKAANMLYKGLPYASMAFGMRDRSVAWMVIQHAGSFTTRNEERFKSSQWESQGWQTMANDIRNLPSPLGSTMGFLIEQTDEDKISKVMLE